MKPVHTTLNKLLHRRLQFSFHEIEVINSTDSCNTPIREARALAVHEGSTRSTEIICHRITRRNSLRLGKCSEVFLAAEMLEVGVVDGKVGCEH